MEIIQRIKNIYSQIFSKQSLDRIIKNEQSGFMSIPIRPHISNTRPLPIHISHKRKLNKLSPPIITALGGLANIESYLEIPNSRRIRLTLVNPSLIDTVLLDEIDVRMFIRIGKRIVHIIP